MAEQFKERRSNGTGELRAATTDLQGIVSDLRVAVGELKVTVSNLSERDRDDRANAVNVAADVTMLKLWQARIKGQLALVYLLLGALLGLMGHVLKILP